MDGFYKRLQQLGGAICVAILSHAAPVFADSHHDQAGYPDAVYDPVYGVNYNWNDLAQPDFTMFHDAGTPDQRVWARVPVGQDELVYVQSMVPIYADIDPEPAIVGYEEDGGQLFKRIGLRALTFGGGSGQFATDYPEIRESLIEQLLYDYVQTLRSLYPDSIELTQLIEQSRLCEGLDSLAVAALRRHSITPECQSNSVDSE